MLDAIWDAVGSCKDKIIGVSADDKGMDQEEAWSDDFFKEILIRPLMEMHDKATDMAMKERKETPFKIVHKDEDRYPEEYPIDPDHFRKFLNRRVSQIEKIIDNHIEALFDDANDDPSEKIRILAGNEMEKFEFLNSKISDFK